MEHYRRTAHTRFDIKFHLVWITKYRSNQQPFFHDSRKFSTFR